MNNIKFDIEELRKWQQEGNRSVEIILGEVDDKNIVKVWCFDYSLLSGQFIEHSVSELHLIDNRIKLLEDEIAKYKKMKEVI